MLFSAQWVSAVPVDTFTFQGLLKNDSGVLVTGKKDITLRLYTIPTGGSASSSPGIVCPTTFCVWQENQTSIDVTNGIFTIFAGNTTSLNRVDFTKALYLEVIIRSGLVDDATRGADQVLSPRINITASPFALSTERGHFGYFNGTQFLINQTGTTSTKTVMNITNSGLGSALWIKSGATFNNVINVTAFALTSGAALNITSSSADAVSNRNLVVINQNSTVATGAIALKVNQGGPASAVVIKSETTGTVDSGAVNITAGNLGAGRALLVASTSGSLTARSLVEIAQDSAAATAATALEINQASTARALDVNGGTIDIDAGTGLDITLDVTGTGDIILTNVATGDITLTTGSGDIILTTATPGLIDINGGTIDIDSGANLDVTIDAAGTGDIRLSTAATGDIVLDATTGEILISTAGPGDIKLDTTATGDIELTTTSTGEIQLLTADTTGTITLDGGTIDIDSGANLDVTIDAAGTGDIRLSTAATGDIVLTTVTGDIILTAPSTGLIDLESGTGDNNAIEVDLGTTTTAFAVCHDTAAATINDVELRDCTGTGADYAEDYPVSADVELTDVVILGSTPVITTEGDTIVQLVKSSTPYDVRAVGVVVNNTSDFSSTGHNIAEEDNPMPVALVGRVSVKVTNEGGPIQVGDSLTTSSTPGHAMKLVLLEYTGDETIAELVAKISENERRLNSKIGMALGSFDGEAGQVMMFVTHR